MKQTMRRLIHGGLWVLLPLVMFGADLKKPGKPAPPPAIARLTWLAGSWRLEQNGRVIDAQWMAPAAGVMLGMARTLAKGRAVAHEFMQIREGPGGDLFYVTQPSGQKEAAFQILSLTGAEAVFENREHDFPRKITYRHEPDGSLLTVIEGVGPDGAAKRIESSYQRAQP